MIPTLTILHRHRRRRGFTLIELMVVVAIIGVLASVAMPAFMRYVKRSKTSEALMGIRTLYTGAVAYLYTEHIPYPNAPATPPQFPHPDETATPGVCDVGTVPTDLKQYVNFEDIAHAACFESLLFNFIEPLRYNYTFDTATPINSAPPPHFIASAFGDLDGDGHLSTFSRNAFLIEGDTLGSAGLFMSDRLE